METKKDDPHPLQESPFDRLKSYIKQIPFR